MITEKYTGSQKSTQRAKMVPALTQTQQIDKQTTNAKCPPTTQHWVFLNFHSILPAECSQSQLHPQLDAGPWPYAGLNPVTRASHLPSTKPGPGLMLDLPLHFTPRCLPSTILGPGLNLGFCNVSTGAQSSYLLTRLLPSTRRVVLPGGTEIPDKPPDVMHRAHISEPTERASPPQYCKRKKGVCLFLAC